MIVEGKLTIKLGPDVRIHSNRTASVAAMMVGRKVDEALELLPVLYALCAHAHVVAAHMATGRDMPFGAGLLVLAENAREHLLRIMLGWRTESQITMPAPPVMALVPDMKQAVDNGVTDQVAEQLALYLDTHVLGCSPAQFLQCDVSEWVSNTDTSPAHYLRAIIAKDWQSVGTVAPAFLPDLKVDPLVSRMQQEGFCLQPNWLNKPRETGPFARQKSVQMVANIVRTHGAGLLARLVARLVELAQIPAQMRADKMLTTAQPALGIVETARGRLVHWASVKDGVITDYRILAPTEWNFHPRGVAVQALKGLDADQAKAVIEAIDPCVDFELRAA